MGCRIMEPTDLHRRMALQGNSELQETSILHEYTQR